MKQKFINYHIEIFLEILAKSNKPLDLCLNQYFRNHKNLGSTDRRLIGNTIYGMIRWKSLLDHFSPKDPVSFYQNIQWESLLSNPSIPIFARLGLSEFLYTSFCNHFGQEKTTLIAQTLNQPAPTTIRVNPIKTTRENLLNLWKDRFSIQPCKHSPNGIQFKKREPLFSLPEYKQGLFEMQDEGSQLIANTIDAKPGDCVLDYCSGSGGKTLGFAHKLKGKGQIYLHDIRLRALQEARTRLKRAGIQNAQCLPPGHPKIKQLIGKCDWVLIDVPCSGTGTLRRNPDQKWKIDAEMIKKLVQQQRTIIDQAMTYLSPQGKLVYATCSLLNEENQDQVDYILQKFQLQLTEEPTLLIPEDDGMDGFFYSIFSR